MATSQYGYANYYTPPKPKKISMAQAAVSQPFSPNNRADPFNLVNAPSYAAAPAKAPYTQSQVTASLAANPNASKGGYEGPTPFPTATTVAQQNPGGLSQPPTASQVNNYDPNTDVAFQQINASLGLSDEQAQAAAAKQRRDVLLAYGDPNLAGQSNLGGDNTLAQAAAANPTSTIAQLRSQKTQNLDQLDQALNDQNLIYSGYRVKQEGQAAQDYQNALAQAAAGVNTNLDSITGGLNQVLAGNAQQRAQALFQAESLAAQYAMQNGVDPGDPGVGGAGGGGGATSGGMTGAENTGAPGGLAPAAGYALAQAAIDAARRNNQRGQYF